METQTIPISKIRQKGVWHFTPYSRTARQTETILENSLDPVVKLKDLVSTYHIGPIERSIDLVPDIPLLTPKNLTFQGIDLTNLRYLTREQHEKRTDTRLRTNDVILNIIGQPTIAVVYNSDRPANINHALVRLQLKPAIDPAYFVHYINSELGQNLLKTLRVGSVMPTLPISRLLELPVILPALEKQNEIIHSRA